MKDEKHETAPHADGEGALFEYLDDLLHDPAAGSSTATEKPVTVPEKSKLTNNIRLFNAGRKALRSSSVATAPADSNSNISEQPSTSAAESKLRTDIKIAIIDVPERGGHRASWLSPSLLAGTHENSDIEAQSSRPFEAKQNNETNDIPQKIPPNIVADELNSVPEPEKIPEPQPWCENGRPLWAQQGFECLIFSVNGLKLAVPLITLGSIQPLDKKLTGLPGQPDWFMGILPDTAHGNLKVLDTALCVMPERYQLESRQTLNYVISIHGYSWGLACDTVEKSITLQPDQVKWRTQRGKRPWLAGTVVEYMCSLVDTDGFQQFII